jgi:predicted glycoside hydrolase/deacetylase ChbG (UPF0249 family)
MKWIGVFSLMIFCIFTVDITSCRAQKTKLIIRGDDMGYSHAGNVALIKAYTEGIERSIEVIVPSPWFPEAVKMLKENPGVDVGIHLAITSEWDNIKWRPLTAAPSLRDPDGYFLPMIWPNKNYSGLSVKESHYNVDDIEKEFRAQIEMALKKIPRISHISAHMGCSDIDDAVRNMTKKLAVEYKIDIDPAQYNVKGIRYEGPSATFEEKKSSFIAALKKLQKGNTYIFVDHPGLDNDEVRAIHHIGYETVAQDRQGVTSLWTDPEVIKLIKDLNIELISYRDLSTH